METASMLAAGVVLMIGIYGLMGMLFRVPHGDAQV